MRRLRFLGIPLLVLSLLVATASLAAAQEQPPVTAQAVQLNPVGGSGVSGVVELTALGLPGRTRVVVTASGLSPREHANHIHAGSCANLGGIQINLTNLQADAQGNAPATTTTIDRSLDTLSGAIAIHAGPLPAPIVACGDIPAVTAAPAARPAVAGGPAPLLAAGVLGMLGLLTLGGGLFLRRR